uniref:Release factor glutamine methyltransferase N-terminal domain-containing protein n=1 Tax=Anopheles farauti TaxID=69004 RepID=A0A182Q746_9DIPT
MMLSSSSTRAAARMGVTLLSRLQARHIDSVPSSRCCYSGNVGSVAPQTLVTTTVRGTQEKWMKRFESESIPEPETSITNIIAHVLELPGPGEVGNHQNSSLSEAQMAKIEELCECRLARMPIQYIIREWDFRDLTLKMIPPVFIPRPETEELVELILQQMDNKEETLFLEIGCGTGAISLSLLKHAPKIYEDLRALDGGTDGLTVIKAILRIASRHLAKDGVLWLEVDSTHPPIIEQFLTKHGELMGLKFMASYKDLFQKDRFVEIVKQ